MATAPQKLTKPIVEKLPFPVSGQVILWDPEKPCFGVRLTPGSKTYIVQARVNGKNRRVKLGPHGEMTADQARKKADTVIGNLRAGKDPVVENKNEQARAVTLKEVAHHYIEARRSLKPASIESINRHLTTTFKLWADKPAAKISRDMVAHRFKQKTAESPAQANQAFRVLRGLLNFARATWRPDDKPLFLENPVNVLSDQRTWNKVNPRSNRVKVDEIGKFWLALYRLRHDPAATFAGRTAADYVLFLLLTGCRGGEAAELQWEHIDFDRNSFAFVAPKTEPVILPMSRQLRAMLEARPRVNEFVFPGRSRVGHLADCRDVFEKIERQTGVKVSRHDLRRTFTTIGQHLHIELWRIDFLQNHKAKTITLKHYTDNQDRSWLQAETQAISDFMAGEGFKAFAAPTVDLATGRAM